MKRESQEQEETEEIVGDTNLLSLILLLVVLSLQWIYVECTC